MAMDLDFFHLSQLISRRYKQDTIVILRLETSMFSNIPAGSNSLTVNSYLVRRLDTVRKLRVQTNLYKLLMLLLTYFTAA